MTQRPDPTWYTLDADTSAPTRLLDDEGRPAPGLVSDAQRALAWLAAAVHATAWRLPTRGDVVETILKFYAERTRHGSKPREHFTHPLLGEMLQFQSFPRRLPTESHACKGESAWKTFCRRNICGGKT